MRRHITSGGIAAMAALVMIASATLAEAVTIIYTDDGPAQKLSHSEGGVLVTGLGTLNFTALGLGVIGHNDDTLVDGGEYLDFTAAGNNLLGSLSSTNGSAYNMNGGATSSFVIEGFDTLGAQVASFNYETLGTPLFSDDFVWRLGAGPLKKIRVRSNGDGYELNSINATFVPVPEPTTAAAVLGALILTLRSTRGAGRADTRLHARCFR